MASEIAVVAPQITPMELLQRAVDAGAQIDTIERLAKLQREMLDYDAKTAWHEAMQRVQDKMRPISADMNNPQTRSKYASYGKIDKILRPLYSGEGFALSFDTAESHIPDCIRIVCNVSRGGHSKPYQIDMPNDGKGAKGGDVMTKPHATGAAVAYGMRYLLKMIFNVAVGEDDDDGNIDGGVKVPREKVGEWLKSIDEATELTGLMKLWGKIYTTANEMGDKNALDILIPAYEARKEELA